VAAAETRSRDSTVALSILCGALALVIGSMSSLSVALPVIGQSTKATQADLTWIIDAYAVTFAGLLLPAGALGDKYGRRRMLVLGLAIFGIASLIGPLLGTPGALIGVRATSGVGAALAMPATLSLIATTVREEDQERAVGLWAGVATMGGVLGIVFAGAVLELASWDAIFYVTAALAALLCVACRLVPESSEDDQPRFDAWGAATSAGAVGLIVFGINEVPSHGWSSATVGTCIAIGALLAVAFVQVELRAANPLLDLRIFRARPVLIGTVTLAVLFAVMFAFFFVIMQYLQLIQGRSAWAGGLAIIPMAVTIIPLSLLAPRLVAAAGLRVVTFLGLICLIGACLILGTIGPDARLAFLAAVLLMGANLGLCVTPGTLAILHSVPAHKKGVASAVNDAAREVGAALGIAIAGTLLATGYSRHLGDAVESLPEPAQTQSRASLAGATEAASQLGTAGHAALDEAQSAFLAGMHLAFIVLAIFLGLSAVAIAAVAPGPQRGVGGTVGWRAGRGVVSQAGK
jgi:MFS family permease